MRSFSALVLFFITGLASSAADRPNILFIISDDLSAEALSCYGNQQCQTPHIDSLAKQGMKFTRAYCQFPVCGPSRAALMSGMYPQAVGVTGNGSSENFTKRMGNRPSMTQLFKENGWYSARVSKIYHMRVPGDITKGVDGPDHAASWSERFNAHAPEWMSKGGHTHLTNEKLR
ncbi:sulfatase-like hydrolase/transferase, partial [Planctomycetaceae bacterium]|nr:sulfatase-like hydrolase/transferase [Planctomycetaceae bacterium]